VVIPFELGDISFVAFWFYKNWFWWFNVINVKLVVWCVYPDKVSFRYKIKRDNFWRELNLLLFFETLIPRKEHHFICPGRLFSRVGITRCQQSTICLELHQIQYFLVWVFELLKPWVFTEQSQILRHDLDDSIHITYSEYFLFWAVTQRSYLVLAHDLLFKFVLLAVFPFHQSLVLASSVKETAAFCLFNAQCQQVALAVAWYDGVLLF
jgi:hypothetical protein